MNFKIPYKDTKHFSRLILDYLNNDEKLKPFVNDFPKIENFANQIKEKKTHQLDRGVLVEVLKRQNADFPILKNTIKNIDLLELDTTFSVTTGHQLCLFTGPLYFFYKIISTINLCEQLNIKYLSNNFVPIFWMATEDHDLNEVNHIYLFGKKIEWDTNQSGAVGRMTLDAFESVILELKSSLGSNENMDKLIVLFENAYLNHDNLADATRYLVNELFGQYGLVIIDGDDKHLKKQFIPQISKDILDSGFVSDIKSCSDNLANEYNAQAYVRDINFFRLSENKRVLVEDPVSREFIVNNADMFSPNVLLRPLYQEVILPNIAYIGGESELAYWMQLKSAFKNENIPFPLLVLRNSALLIDNKQKNKFEKLGFQLSDLFLSEDDLNKKYILAHSSSEISLENDKNNLRSLYMKIVSKSSDISMQKSIMAQLHKQLSWLDSLQVKLIRIEKKKSITAISQISKIKKHLFPNNALQERYNTFIPFYLECGDNFIKILKKNLDPLSTNFVVLTLKN